MILRPEQATAIERRKWPGAAVQARQAGKTRSLGLRTHSLGRSLSPTVHSRYQKLILAAKDRCEWKCNARRRNPGTAGHPCNECRFDSPACETKNQVNLHAADTIIIINLAGIVRHMIYTPSASSFLRTTPALCMHVQAKPQGLPDIPPPPPPTCQHVRAQGGKGLGGGRVRKIRR